MAGRLIRAAAAVLALACAGCTETKTLLSKVGVGDGEPAKPAEAPPTYVFCEACLIDGSGRMVARSDTIRGDLERAEKIDGRIVITGWAADGAQPPQWTLLVSNGAVIARAAPDQPRPDIAARLQAKSDRLGYQLSAPESSFGPTAAIWVIGTDGKAAPLDKALRR